MSDWDKPKEDMVNEMLDRKTLIKTQAKEIEKLRAALKKISVTARRKDETPEALLVVCDAIARAPLGEGP
jgi:hypothetical protein